LYLLPLRNRRIPRFFEIDRGTEKAPLILRGNVKIFMKNRGTNETTESAEKSSVSSKRVAPSPSPLPCVGERDGMRGKWLGWL
jgi:hypothetical protein